MHSHQGDSVFINCPFDSQYKRLFDATVFAIFDAGFVARCALEVSDGTQSRFEKIVDLIGACKYGIHDISRTGLDRKNGLPRFNMPLELGLFLGCKRFGGKGHSGKSCLILDRSAHRYQMFISDISGQDVVSHRNSPRRLVQRIRDWLRTESGRVSIPGASEIWSRYTAFRDDLPRICAKMRIRESELTFMDYQWAVKIWLG